MRRRKSGDFCFSNGLVIVPCGGGARGLQLKLRGCVAKEGLCKGATRREFMRKGVMAITAALALGTATIATGAMAQHHSGMAGGGGAPSGGGGAAFSGGGGGAAFHGGGQVGGGGAPMAAAPRASGGATFNGGTAFNSGQRFSGQRFNSGQRFSGGSTFNGGSTTFNGGRFAFRHHHRHFHGGFGLFAFGGPSYYYDDGCWRWRRVWTPYGWRWRRVDICY
jgi:hypothetical protein